jgi:hypothetical protein
VISIIVTLHEGLTRVRRVWHFPCASWITVSQDILCETHSETCNTASKGCRGSRRWWKDGRHPRCMSLLGVLHLVSNLLMPLYVPLRTYHLVTSTSSLTIDRHPHQNTSRHNIDQARLQVVNSRHDGAEKHNSPGWCHGAESA